MQLAKRLGVTPDTVRFYTRIGYLRPEKSPPSGYKVYKQKDLDLLRFILSARHLGFSVADIGQILDTAENGKSPCPVARTLIQQRLAENEKTFTDSAMLRQRMLAAINEWGKKPDRLPTGNMICHLIEDFSDDGIDN
jgi:DNA-binding transcriptional MerR regulator